MRGSDFEKNVYFQFYDSHSDYFPRHRNEFVWVIFSGNAQKSNYTKLKKVNKNKRRIRKKLQFLRWYDSYKKRLSNIQCCLFVWVLHYNSLDLWNKASATSLFYHSEPRRLFVGLDNGNILVSSILVIYLVPVRSVPWKKNGRNYFAAWDAFKGLFGIQACWSGNAFYLKKFIIQLAPRLKYT